MAALPYMQLYVADYLADTSHLNAAQHGAYLLLLMNYWQRGKALRNDDVRLANVARMSNEEWNANREVLAEFFVVSEHEWVHGRVERDLEFVLSKSSKASSAGKASAQARANAKSTNVERMSDERCNSVQQKVNHTDTDTDTDIDIEAKAEAESKPSTPPAAIASQSPCPLGGNDDDSFSAPGLDFPFKKEIPDSFRRGKADERFFPNDEPETMALFSTEPKRKHEPEPIVGDLPCAKAGETWGYTAAQFDGWTQDFPGVDVPQQLRNMRQWLLANPRRGKTRRGMLAFAVNWLTRAQNQAPAQTQLATTTNPQGTPKRYESSSERKARIYTTLCQEFSGQPQQPGNVTLDARIVGHGPSASDSAGGDWRAVPRHG